MVSLFGVLVDDGRRGVAALSAVNPRGESRVCPDLSVVKTTARETLVVLFVRRLFRCNATKTRGLVESFFNSTPSGFRQKL